jgi:hypothetical protein
MEGTMTTCIYRPSKESSLTQKWHHQINRWMLQVQILNGHWHNTNSFNLVLDHFSMVTICVPLFWALFMAKVSDVFERTSLSHLVGLKSTHPLTTQKQLVTDWYSTTSLCPLYHIASTLHVRQWLIGDISQLSTTKLVTWTSSIQVLETFPIQLFEFHHFSLMV